MSYECKLVPFMHARTSYICIIYYNRYYECKVIYIYINIISKAFDGERRGVETWLHRANTLRAHNSVNITNDNNIYIRIANNYFQTLIFQAMYMRVRKFSLSRHYTYII